jgi:hypothetical protein
LAPIAPRAHRKPHPSRGKGSVPTVTQQPTTKASPVAWDRPKQERPAKQSKLLDTLECIRLDLQGAMASAVVCRTALAAQNADYDNEIALVLQRGVVDELDRQIRKVDTVLKRADPS